MKSAVTILAGLATGILLAIGILAAFVFVGPDPVGLQQTPAPSFVTDASASPPPSVMPSPSAPGSGSPSPSGSAAAPGLPGASPSGSGPAFGDPGPSPSGSDAP
jgi:hypothetical protein